MDARTWQALTTGHVDLPSRRIHVGIWFRLLRTLIDELGATLTKSGAAQRLIREVHLAVRLTEARWSHDRSREVVATGDADN